MPDEVEQVREKEQNVGGERVVTREVNSETRDDKVNMGVRVVWFIVGILVALLILRIILALMGANLDNAFASFIYALTDPFVAPFRGLLQQGEFQAGVSRLELETIVSVIVYVLIGWGISAAVKLFSKRAV